MVEIFLIAVSLALDAFAVSVSSGISIPGFGPRQAVKMGLWFGTFQFLMPLLGWLLGSSVSQYIEAVDHWVAFGLLAVIGGKMAWESLRRGCGEEDEAPPDLSARRLCVLAIATSIDALAVGVSMAFMIVHILASAAVIGVVAFALSVTGGLVGRRLPPVFPAAAERTGTGCSAATVKILIEHLSGGGAERRRPAGSSCLDARPATGRGLVGAGGKTSTLYALARQAADSGRTVVVTTTTHILRHPGLPLVEEPTPERLRAALEGHGVVTVGTVFRGDKLSGAGTPEELRRAADVRVLVRDRQGGAPAPQGPGGVRARDPPLRRRRGRRGGGHGRGGTGRGGGLPPAGAGVRPAGRGGGARAHPRGRGPSAGQPPGRKGVGKPWPSAVYSTRRTPPSGRPTPARWPDGWRSGAFIAPLPTIGRRSGADYAGSD